MLYCNNYLILLYVQYRSDSAKAASHIPSTLARRALRHDIETISPTVATPDSKDFSKNVLSAKATKPNVQEEFHQPRSKVHRRRLSVARRLTVRKRRRTISSALSYDVTVTTGEVCDNPSDAVRRIRTRRMSAAAEAAACDDQKAVNLTASENVVVNPDNRSRLSSISTAVTAATSVSTEIAGL